LYAPALEYIPEPHPLHAPNEEPPAVLRYFPALQFEHDAAPLFEYFPGEQFVHVAVLSAEYFPAAQGVQPVAPGLEYFPAVHDTHKSETSTPMLSPSSTFGAVMPAGQS
jgi:hypothetical protein